MATQLSSRRAWDINQAFNSKSSEFSAPKKQLQEAKGNIYICTYIYTCKGRGTKKIKKGKKILSLKAHLGANQI